MKDNNDLEKKICDLKGEPKEVLKCFISLLEKLENDETIPQYSDIANKLDKQEATVRKHMSTIYEVLGLTEKLGKNTGKQGSLLTLYVKNKQIFDNILFPPAPGNSQINSDFNEVKKKQLYQDFAVYQQEYWVGRKQETEKLLKSVNGYCRIAILLGITGIGKTALAEKLVNELKIDRDILLRKNFDYLHTNSEKFFVDTAKEWLAKLGETVAANEENPEKILLLLVNKLCHSHHLILIDSFEYILTGNEDAGWGNFFDDWWNKFFKKILSAESCESRFIITSQDLPTQLQEIGSQSPNFFNYQILKGLEENQQIELFEKYGLNCDRQTKPLLTRIGKAYMGHPLAIKVIAKEIKIDFNGNVVEYWEEFGSQIEKVEKSLEEAEQGKTQGKDDWELDRYSKQLRREVKNRLKITFERLEKNSYIAFILICKVSVYRKPERESAWLAQLKSTSNTKEIRNALDILKDRGLVETIYDSRTQRNFLGLHNLIRSQALHCLRTID